ncbi:cell wall-binding protein [Methylocaldum sp.]|uniref:cell wall-binding protein n=1 Tax=Methylocaldum sp. TaxID=1969727 RepID=UPI002D30B124|nr:cell wall-binding protein [Methylocaldum sp.]HYE35387.1 cell wall-binding protein [Methylocaldum sp.]
MTSDSVISLDKAKVSRTKKSRRSGGGGGRASADHLPYEIDGNQIWLYDDEGRRPLCNFVATITEETLHDNGLEEEVLFRIEGRLRDGTPLPPVEIPASKYPALSWVSSAWGARAVVYAGTSIKDHTRVAIQVLSPNIKRRTVYGHTGFRKIAGEWLYLHAGGALGAAGHRADVEVRTGEGHMKRYRFDAAAGDLRADIRSSLKLLDIAPDNPGLGVVLLASVYRAPLGEAAVIDHGVFLAGQTGARKSEAAGIALAHFGRGFDARHFPANFDDTESDLEAKGHAAKDALMVVDDFKPRGTVADVHKLHVKADRLFRSAGNQAGRGRRTSDMKQRAAYHPRGLVLATGEDVPRGQSLRARLVIVELSVKDVDNAVLTELQTSAREGALERAMVGYLRWLAPNMDEWKASLPGYLRAFRDRAISEGFASSHPRAADIYASLLTGLDLFRQYAVEAGALADADAAPVFERCETVLKDLIAAQGDMQTDQDEVVQFLGFLKSSLNAGYCHFSDYLSQGAPPEHPSFWGWRIIPSADEGAPSIEKPQGERIGWVDPVRVCLDGHAAFAAVQEMAKATGENLAITERSLWRRMYERGLLLDVQKEAGKVRLSPKRVIAGVSRRVYVMARRTLED